MRTAVTLERGASVAWAALYESQHLGSLHSSLPQLHDALNRSPKFLAPGSSQVSHSMNLLDVETLVTPIDDRVLAAPRSPEIPRYIFQRL